MNQSMESSSGGGDRGVDRGGGKPVDVRRRADAFTLMWTLLTVALLGFATFAKFYQPQHEKELMDRGIASVQVLVIIGVVVLWRKWWTWGALSLMWTGMAAWSLWSSAHGAKCGCFGALVDVPPFVSGTADVMFALVSLGLALLRGAPAGMLAGLVIGLAPAWGLGWYGASTFVDPSNETVIDEMIDRAGGVNALTPPDESDDPAPDGSSSEEQTGDEPAADEPEVDPAPTEPTGIAPPRIPEIPGYTAARTKLLESALMSDIREQEFGGPSWLIFVFDPDCHICEELMPYVEFMGGDWADNGDPVMQARTYSIPDLRDEIGIERHEWPDTPTLFVVRDGEIVAQWYGATAEGWTDQEIQMIYDAIEYDDPALYPAQTQWKELEAIERNRR